MEKIRQITTLSSEIEQNHCNLTIFFDEKMYNFLWKKIRQITTLSSKIEQNHCNLTIVLQFYFKLVNYKCRGFLTILESKLMDAQVGKGGQKCLKLRHAL